MSSYNRRVQYDYEWRLRTAKKRNTSVTSVKSTIEDNYLEDEQRRQNSPDR